MEISIEKTPIRDVVVVKPDVFEDERGFFTEVYRKDKFKERNEGIRSLPRHSSGELLMV